MGEWLRANGETVYGTVSAGIDPQPWGAVTRKGDKIYVHVLTPQNSEIYLPLDCRIKISHRICRRRKVPFTRTPGGIVLSLPQLPADNVDYIITLSTR